MTAMLQRIHSFSLSLIPPGTVLIVHLVRHHFRPDLIILDVVAHFAGGFAIAWMAHILLKGMKARKEIPSETPSWLVYYVMIATVFVAGVLWEFMEWGLDTFLGTVTQFTIPETMGDLFMDVSGGLAFLLLLSILQRRDRRG